MTRGMIIEGINCKDFIEALNKIKDDDKKSSLSLSVALALAKRVQEFDFEIRISGASIKKAEYVKKFQESIDFFTRKLRELISFCESCSIEEQQVLHRHFLYVKLFSDYLHQYEDKKELKHHFLLVPTDDADITVNNVLDYFQPYDNIVIINFPKTRLVEKDFASIDYQLSHEVSHFEGNLLRFRSKRKEYFLTTAIFTLGNLLETHVDEYQVKNSKLYDKLKFTYLKQVQDEIYQLTLDIINDKAPLPYNTLYAQIMPIIRATDQERLDILKVELESRIDDVSQLFSETFADILPIYALALNQELYISSLIEEFPNLFFVDETGILSTDSVRVRSVFYALKRLCSEGKYENYVKEDWLFLHESYKKQYLVLTQDVKGAPEFLIIENYLMDCFREFTRMPRFSKWLINCTENYADEYKSLMQNF